MTDEQAIELLMLPGFSTADKVSNISGRGVGMDVVKATIEKLRGHISIESVKNKGTKISILVPSSLTITNCLLFKLNDEKYIIPIQSVYEVLEIPRKNLLSENGDYFIDLSKKEVLNLEFRKKIKVKFLFENGEKENLYIILLSLKDDYIGLAVDKILNQLEVIINPLNRYFFKDVNLFNGVALLGDNTPSLVINPNYIFE